MPQEASPKRAKMALDPLELGTVAVIIIVFLLWGPQKIPELARMVTQARREFDNATKEFQKVSTSIQEETNSLLAPPTPATGSALPPPPAEHTGVKTGDQLLIEAARRLGIPTQGKTREQIQQDIIAMARRPDPTGGPPQPPKTDDSAA
jgi:sec-independent protein translocase protein TatA